jgi:hypothetical protein
MNVSKLTFLIFLIYFPFIYLANAIRLFCKNFTEPDDPAPGKCTTIIIGQMPGQTEVIFLNLKTLKTFDLEWVPSFIFSKTWGSQVRIRLEEGIFQAYY